MFASLCGSSAELIHFCFVLVWFSIKAGWQSSTLTARRGTPQKKPEILRNHPSRTLKNWREQEKKENLNDWWWDKGDGLFTIEKPEEGRGKILDTSQHPELTQTIPQSGHMGCRNILRGTFPDARQNPIINLLSCIPVNLECVHDWRYWEDIYA